MSHEIFVLLSNVLVALLSAGGFWALLEKIPNERRKKREKSVREILIKIDKIDKENDENAKDIKELNNSVHSILNGMKTMYDNQKDCAVKIANSEELSRAYSRDRLNHLSNIYIKQGYIPKEDIIPYKMLGKAYISSGGNSEIKTKFEHCINNLEVK